MANKYKYKYFLSSSSKRLDKCGCVVDYNPIPTGWYQYLQVGYIVLCTSVNKTIIIIIITIIIIIIIIIIIVMKSGAPLLGLAKSFYYILVYTGKNPQFPRLVKSCFLLGKSSNSQFDLFLRIWCYQDSSQEKRILVSIVYQENTTLFTNFKISTVLRNHLNSQS